MKKVKPLILIDDDGISAPGIALIDVMSAIGEVVICSDKPQSAMGHATTIPYI
jgi:broad specificity polyphosphatase/5'/3'-nucleotidase SurE